MIALALTVTSAVATLGMEASLDVADRPGRRDSRSTASTRPCSRPVNNDAGEDAILRPVVYSLDALLLFVGIVNLVATLLLTTRERVRDLGMLGAVGMKARQVDGSLVSEQGAVAVLAGLVGLPLGLLFFRGAIALTGSSDEFAYPSWWSLALLVPALVGSGRPARRAARAAGRLDQGGRRASLRVDRRTQMGTARAPGPSSSYRVGDPMTSLRRSPYRRRSFRRSWVVSCLIGALAVPLPPASAHSSGQLWTTRMAQAAVKRTVLVQFPASTQRALAAEITPVRQRYAMLEQVAWFEGDQQASARFHNFWYRLSTAGKSRAERTPGACGRVHRDGSGSPRETL